MKRKKHVVKNTHSSAETLLPTSNGNKYPDPKLTEDVTTQLVKTKEQEIKYYHRDIKNLSEITNNTNF